MDTRSIKRTEQIAPILRLLESSHPDYKDLTLRLLKYFGLEELGYVLTQKRQDWQAIAQSLLPALHEDAAYLRSKTVLDALSDSPQQLEELQQACGLHKMSISQTINALERGGYSIPYESVGQTDGRPCKAFYLREGQKTPRLSKP